MEASSNPLSPRVFTDIEHLKFAEDKLVGRTLAACITYVTLTEFIDADVSRMLECFLAVTSLLINHNQEGRAGTLGGRVTWRLLGVVLADERTLRRGSNYGQLCVVVSPPYIPPVYDIHKREEN